MTEQQFDEQELNQELDSADPDLGEPDDIEKDLLNQGIDPFDPDAPHRFSEEVSE